MTIVVLAAVVGGAALCASVRWALPGRAVRAGRPLGPTIGPSAGRVGLAATVGLLAGIVTGWPVGGLLAVAAVVGLPALWSETAARRVIDHHEAIASWTEMLRDTLHASVGLSQAIVATAAVAPLAVRPAVERLAARLSTGVAVEQALRSLADELDDSTVDMVVCALLLAASAKAQRLADVLGALATTTREQVAMELRVEAVRVSARSSVRMVMAFTVAFVAGVAVLGHTYLAPFGTAQGQVVLAVAGGCDAAGLWLLVRMTRPPAPVHLLHPDRGALAP